MSSEKQIIEQQAMYTGAQNYSHGVAIGAAIFQSGIIRGAEMMAASDNPAELLAKLNVPVVYEPKKRAAEANVDSNFSKPDSGRNGMSVVTSMVEFADRFGDLVSDHSKWSQATFGTDSERGPMGPLKHLEKEARECQEAVGTPELTEELADCLLLLLDASRRSGLKPMDLVKAAQKKMETNKARTWPKPTSDEPVEHVR